MTNYDGACCRILRVTSPKHPYYAIPYHTIPYHNIPYHTIPYLYVITQSSQKMNGWLFLRLYVVYT